MGCGVWSTRRLCRVTTAANHKNMRFLLFVFEEIFLRWARFMHGSYDTRLTELIANYSTMLALHAQLLGRPAVRPVSVRLKDRPTIGAVKTVEPFGFIRNRRTGRFCTNRTYFARCPHVLSHVGPTKGPAQVKSHVENSPIRSVARTRTVAVAHREKGRRRIPIREQAGRLAAHHEQAAAALSPPVSSAALRHCLFFADCGRGTSSPDPNGPARSSPAKAHPVLRVDGWQLQLHISFCVAPGAEALGGLFFAGGGRPADRQGLRLPRRVRKEASTPGCRFHVIAGGERIQQ
ncbi:hypothetical protein SEVIR_9G432350v4 [Setaria viridis]|uniref:Uncharacterized protein n=2 Tax=Setaria TaxID=4554 RepID=A0A368SRW8_SETIT|nr:hypothetical protein SETIT_9G428000v2 [Setaria italica]TKV96492.1 hypothetical protein SEVIR_9G432350v2 [Setaria viridis]